jgi:hypothetical protein
MKEKFLEQRLELSNDLNHYVLVNKLEKAQIIQEEIKNIDIILINLFNKNE